MPITNTNLKYYLSGGAGNSDQNASLGGARSTGTTATSALFDAVSGAESSAGDTEYRCVYFRNEDADADGLIDPVLWVQANTPSADTTMAIGLDPAGKNGTATTIATENDAPAGVSFTTPVTKGTGLALPSAPYAQNDFIAFWVRRTVSAAASATASDTATFRVEGDTI